MPFDSQLHAERDQCKGALYRLNSTSNNHLEITREERDRHFRALVAAKWTQYRGPNAPPPQGSVGNQVHVDTPFHCEYGYNLHVGDYVTIGTGCRFLDSGRITIGRNTTIDASVLINSRRAPEDTKALKGSRRTDIAADVHIGENVYIGPNCIIYAGVKIGTGAIIEGGSVVKRVSVTYPITNTSSAVLTHVLGYTTRCCCERAHCPGQNRPLGRLKA